MRADLQQMVFSELNQRGINVHTLFNNAYYEQLLEGSLDSVERFRAYLEYLFHQTEEQMRFAAQTDTVVGRVKSYVQEHLSEDVNRTNVAKQFFLNPDYLARLFKKETGQTLGSYLQAVSYTHLDVYKRQVPPFAQQRYFVPVRENHS